MPVLHLTVNGRPQEWPENTSYYEIAKADEENSGGSKALLVRENHLVRELYRSPKDGADVEYITYQDKEGYTAYRRSLCYLMVKAVDDTFGKHVTVHFSVGGGLYCTIAGMDELTEEDVLKIDARMRELVQNKLPLRKHSMDTREAAALFESMGMGDKVQLLRYRLVSRTNVYNLDGFIDYFYGHMVYDTSFLTEFELHPYGGGVVLRSPAVDKSDRMIEFLPDEKLFRVQKASLAWGHTIGILDVGDLNDCIVSGKSRELVLTQEAWHETQVALIAQKIARDPRIRVVLIAGPSSSGKTTFSHRLSTQLTVYGVWPHPIPMDDYFLNREQTPRHPDGSYNFECLEAIDVEQFNKDLTALLNGEDVELPTFNFKTGRREYKGRHLQIGEKDILVIEGIHGLNEALSYSLPKESKFKIYISALTQLNIDEHNRIPTTDARLLRRIVRDARTRGTTAEETINMWPSVRQGEENYIFPFQESCDVMFNSALIYELSVLKVYAQPLLFSVPESSPAYREACRLLKFLDFFLPMSPENIAPNSLAREFIGGGCFDV